MKKFVIILAGGVGHRLNADKPKQFLFLRDKPIILHSIQRFVEAEPTIQIVVAMRESLLNLWFDTVKEYHFDNPVILSKGGKERFHTVKEALEKIPQDVLVAIHDGVRPLVSKETIRRSFQLAEKEGSAIPVITPAESVRMVVGNAFCPVNRDSVRLIQTPQTFLAEDIKKAYQGDFSPLFTDDASVYETVLEKKVSLFEGNKENIKITYFQDIVIADSLLQFIQ